MGLTHGSVAIRFRVAQARRKSTGCIAVLFYLAVSVPGCGGAWPGSEKGTAPDEPLGKSLSGEGNAAWVPGMQGLWTRARVLPRDLTDEQKERIRQLRSIGYAGGYSEAPVRRGVTVHDQGRAFQGVNLVNSGHAAEAFLIDMHGTFEHRWRFDYDRIPGAATDVDPGLSNTWRRVRLLEDGSLLGIYEGLGLIKIDRDSNFVWYFDGNAHHDLDIAPNGEIWVLTREPAVIPRLQETEPILEDFLSVLSPDGEELYRISLIECFEESEYSHVLRDRWLEFGDIFHTNTLEILDGRLENALPSFQSGNVLLSMRHTGAIAVVDPVARKVVWAAQGDWREQHEPTVLGNGHILLFDNRGNGGYSRVLELDPVSLEVVWSYSGNPPETFFSY